MEQSPFDELVEQYDSWYDGKGKTAFETELAALRPLLPELPGPWLEVGVGTGRFAQALGIHDGIDLSAGLLARARQRGVKAVLGTGEEMPCESGRLGTVFMLTTWAFLANPGKVLAEINRVLGDGGMLVNGYLDRDGKWGASYVEKGRQGHPLHRHARFAGYAEVTAAMGDAGFRVTKTVSTLLAGPGEATKVEEPRDGFHPGASFVVLVAARR